VTHNTVEQFVGDPVGVFRGERDPAVLANVPRICTVTLFGVPRLRPPVFLVPFRVQVVPFLRDHVTSFGVPRLRPPAFGAPFRRAILFLSKVE
jgi:hypothetical protein